MALHQIHFPAIGLLSLYFSFPGMMADCMADLLRTKAVLIPTNSFPD
jgi:hypothetical protein